MKSVIQEASSLSKAIEQGWIKAGKPQEFSIRILQEPNKNFLGITLQNAKVAVFFGKLQDMPPVLKEQKQQPTQKNKPYPPRPPQQKSAQQRRNQNRRPHYKRPPQQPQQPSQQRPPQPEKK
jgi:hypothetical protein